MQSLAKKYGVTRINYQNILIFAMLYYTIKLIIQIKWTLSK